MSKAKSIVETVAFNALHGNVPGVTVFQDVPENFDGDLVVIGDMKSVRLQVKGQSDDRRVTIDIEAEVVADERQPLLDVQDRIEALLDGQSFEEDGWTVEFEFENDFAVLAPDGGSYIGLTTFSAVALN